MVAFIAAMQASAPSRLFAIGLLLIGTGGVSTLQQATAAGGPWMLLVPSCKQGACSSQLHSSHGLQALTQAAERVGLRPAQLLGGRFLVVCKGRHALA